MPSDHDHHKVAGAMTVRSFVQMRHQSSWNQPQPVLMSNKDSVRLASHRVSLPKLRTPLTVTNNNEVELKCSALFVLHLKVVAFRSMMELQFNATFPSYIKVLSLSN